MVNKMEPSIGSMDGSCIEIMGIYPLGFNLFFKYFFSFEGSSKMQDDTHNCDSKNEYWNKSQ